MKVPMEYGKGSNVKTGKYGNANTPKGKAVNGSFEEPKKLAGSHRKRNNTPYFKGHQFSRKAAF